MKNRLRAAGISPWWPPKVLLTLLLVLYGAAAAVFGALTPRMIEAPLLIGQALIVLGAAVHLWHYVLLKRASPAVGMPDRLLTRGGLFSRVRHPMYLGDFVMGCGGFLMAGDAAGAVLLVLLAAVMYPLCRDEDRMMTDLFPADFPAWRARTGALLPPLRPGGKP